jgi:predicted membrane protein
MNSINRKRVRGPVIPAVVLIALGVIFLLTENHIVEARDIWRFWPLLVVIGGVAKIYAHRRARAFEGWVLIAVGLLLQIASLGLIHIATHLLWPLILIGLGVILLWRTLFQSDEPSVYRASHEAENFTMFGGADLSMSGQEFQGTAITVMFGGYNLDLRKSVMKGDKAVVEATAVAGGIELRVPTSWNVVMQGAPIFGGYNDETQHPEPASNPPQLIVKGAVIFGGLSVKN